MTMKASTDVSAVESPDGFHQDGSKQSGSSRLHLTEAADPEIGNVNGTTRPRGDDFPPGLDPVGGGTKQFFGDDGRNNNIDRESLRLSQLRISPHLRKNQFTVALKRGSSAEQHRGRSSVSSTTDSVLEGGSRHRSSHRSSTAHSRSSVATSRSSTATSRSNESMPSLSSYGNDSYSSNNSLSIGSLDFRLPFVEEEIGVGSEAVLPSDRSQTLTCTIPSNHHWNVGNQQTKMSRWEVDIPKEVLSSSQVEVDDNDFDRQHEPISRQWEIQEQSGISTDMVINVPPRPFERKESNDDLDDLEPRWGTNHDTDSDIGNYNKLPPDAIPPKPIVRRTSDQYPDITPRHHDQLVGFRQTIDDPTPPRPVVRHDSDSVCSNNNFNSYESRRSRWES